MIALITRLVLKYAYTGSRYFVTASNACKIIFLKDAAIDFLNFTGKHSGNKLERDVFAKLKDPTELVHLNTLGARAVTQLCACTPRLFPRARVYYAIVRTSL